MRTGKRLEYRAKRAAFPAFPLSGVSADVAAPKLPKILAMGASRDLLLTAQKEKTLKVEVGGPLPTHWEDDSYRLALGTASQHPLY